MKIFKQINNSYEARTEQYDGKEHLVIPTIMMVEGVHAGSAGPMLHLADELGRYPESWNGIPVVVSHPTDGGANISANSPRVLDNEIVGRVFNTQMDGEKLKAEVWLDTSRLEEISPEALTAVQDQKPLDVSVGVFSDEESTPGIHGNEQYETIARNLRPDHLALLPGEEGACSWSDGCGIRANSSNNKNEKKGVEDVKKENEEIEKSPGLTRTKFSNNVKKEDKMSDVKNVPCDACEDLVNKLIANKRTKFEDKDKEELLTLSEDVLNKLLPDKEVKADPIVEKAPQVIVEKKEEPAKTPEEIFKTLPADMQESMNYGLRLHEAEKAKMVKTIVDNHKDTWPEATLKAMDMETLTRVYKMVPEVADYSVQGITVQNVSSNEEDFLLPAGIERDED